jgi:hypothetical protein
VSIKFKETKEDSGFVEALNGLTQNYIKDLIVEYKLQT